MRIREIVFNNVRSFRGEHRISFVDPLTDEVRPVTVIAGTNGTGKTTILETIEAALNFAINPQIGPDILAEIAFSGCVHLEIELDSEDLGEQGGISQQITGYGGSQLIELFQEDWGEQGSISPQIIHLIVGTKNLVQPQIAQWPDAIYAIGDNPEHFASDYAQKMWRRLQRSVGIMQRDGGQLHGGLIHFPQHHQLFSSSLTPEGIQPPPPIRDWISRVSSSEQWKTSLEGFLVWQNYLDLEAHAQRIPQSRLKHFVKEIEEVLGKDRPITISQGRVYISTNWTQDDGKPGVVRLDQLPSGEQHCLLLLGELARRRREGAIILIDEPEASLHPTLQRMLVHQLRKLAREWNCQLILATHSLEVLRAVHKSARINLDHLDQPNEPAETEVEAAA